MDISDNILSSFQMGQSMSQENLEVLNSIIDNTDILDIIEISNTIDSCPEINELKNEFNLSIDKYDEIKEIKTKIR